MDDHPTIFIDAHSQVLVGAFSKIKLMIKTASFNYCGFSEKAIAGIQIMG